MSGHYSHQRGKKTRKLGKWRTGYDGCLNPEYAKKRRKEDESGKPGESHTEEETMNEQGPNPWKTFDGRDVPRWDQLNDQVRAKWCAVAECAVGMAAENELDTY